MKESLVVDARGLTCPQPVLETKRVLDEGNANDFTVLVDNVTARENVARLARNQGCEVQTSDNGAGEFLLRIVRSDKREIPAAQEELLACPAPEPVTRDRLVVYVGNDAMGRGDDALGQKLMRGFLRTWIDADTKPWRIIFINSGVRLTTTDEEAAEAVSLLSEKGVEVLSCGTCLEHFGLVDKLRVGRVTNMFEVIESLNAASKVISPD